MFTSVFSFNPSLKMSETSSSSSTYTSLKICAALFQILINLGIGIYSAVILANNSKDMVPIEIYGFVMTICIFHFVMAPISACSNKNKSASLLSCIGLGLFIWSCVIIFGQNGIDYKSSNPYYMAVFVYFLISVISIGLVLLILPFVCCCMCYKLSKEDIPSKPPINTPATTAPTPETTATTPETLTSIVIA